MVTDQSIVVEAHTASVALEARYEVADEEIKPLVKLAFLNGGVYTTITTGSEGNVQGPQL
jgi:hypothetical protein